MSLDFHRLRLLFLLLIFFIIGCSLKQGVPQWSGSGFIIKEFLKYRSVVILPFKGDDSGEVHSAFTLSFYERFPKISIIERRWVLEVLGQYQTLSDDPLENEKIQKIGKALEAQAIVIGNIYYPSILRWILQIKIIDTETGKVLGRSFVEINYYVAEAKKEAARFAVQKLTTW